MIGDEWIPKTGLNTQKSQLLESLQRSTPFCIVYPLNSRLHKQRFHGHEIFVPSFNACLFRSGVYKLKSDDEPGREV